MISRRMLAGSVLALLLVGCGGSDGNHGPTASVGQFVDSAVEGVSYTTSSGGSGTTDAAGNLSYLPGDTVTFSIGDLVLGSGLGQALITPADITASSAAELNLARFLQSIDDDGDPDNGITITPAVAGEVDAALAGGAVIDFSLDSVSFATSSDLADLLVAIDTVTTAGTASLVSASAARAHLDATLAGVSGPLSYSIDATGGNGGNKGGWANYYGFGIYLQKDAGYGAIEILASGSADASFTPTVASEPDFGARPVYVTVDTEIAIYDPAVDTPPAAGVLYQKQGLYWVYVADGDSDFTNDTYATGLSIASGVTLTLNDVMGNDTAYIGLNNGLVNRGTITGVDVSASQRLDLMFEAENILNLGHIESYGVLPGQNGGFVYMFAFGNPGSDGDIINQGAILTYGANNTDGNAGNGGEVYIECIINGRIENTALIDAHGGIASGLSGMGGLAGDVSLYSYLDLDNSGDVRANGGDGVDGAWNGGMVTLNAFYRGSLRNSGTIDTSGGSGIYGAGRWGGCIDFTAYGGSVINSGDILAGGGDTVDPDNAGLGSGPGGCSYNYTFADDIDGSVPAGDVIFSGNVDVSSGDVLSDTGLASIAGDFYATVSNLGGGGQTISLLGYQLLDTSGGYGGNTGGHAADILVGNEGSGPVTNEAWLLASGGNADPATAGSKGGLGATINLYSGGIGTTTTATLDVSGGSGEITTADGTITIDQVVP